MHRVDDTPKTAPAGTPFPELARRALHAAVGLGMVALATVWISLGGQVEPVTVSDAGAGGDYQTGEPICLPAAALSTNRFGAGVQCIRNRPHCVRAAAFDGQGRLALENRGNPGTFPPYLDGRPFVWFLQETRHYTNYTCLITVDRPSTVYLLIDNRVNDYLPDSSFDDPSLGPPDTQWVLAEGWTRVRTGLSPSLDGLPQGDFVGIDEGSNGSLNQYYAVYSKVFTQPGVVTTRTVLDGNFYCVVIAAREKASASVAPPPSPAGSAPLPR
jgi:hypothetical protein